MNDLDATLHSVLVIKPTPLQLTVTPQDCNRPMTITISWTSFFLSHWSSSVVLYLLRCPLTKNKREKPVWGHRGEKNILNC